MQTIVKRIETKSYIKLERGTRIRSNLQRNTSNIVTLKNMKSRIEKIRKEKDWQKKGGKKRQLQRHQWTKIKNPPVHRRQHSNTNKQAKFRPLKEADKTLRNSPNKGNEMTRACQKV